MILGGEIMTITSTRGRYLGQYGNTYPGFYHDVVVKAGRVYDELTGPNGLPIDEFKQLWECASNIHFGF
jgi:hypothetical protein